MDDPLSAEERANLLAMASDLGAAQTSPWEPACIARAFASPRVDELQFTMQAWIDLAAVRSPLLDGKLPANEKEVTEAYAAFGLVLGADPDEAYTLIQVMERLIAEGFSAALGMRPEGASEERDNDGFGTWLPLFACLVAQCGIAPSEVRRLKVAEAMMLAAGLRHNQSWRVAGTPYALRDIAGKEDEHG